MKEKIQSGLQFFCTNKDNNSVNQILNQYKGKEQIDVLYDHGAYFHTAISHDNPSLLSILLNYMYETKQINVEPKDNNTDQLVRYVELQKILRQCKQEYKTSSAIDSILVKYIPTEEILEIIKTEMSEVGLRVPYLDTKEIVSEYTDLQEVLNELQSIGVSLEKIKSALPYNLTFQHSVAPKHEEAINKSIQLLQAKAEVHQNKESPVIANVVTDIIYNNELLNHPDLLKEPLKTFTLNQIIDMSLNLDQRLVDEAVNNYDSTLVLAGLISLAEENSYE